VKEAFAVNAAIFMIATSYLTLGIFAPAKASHFWWQYAIIIFALTVISLIVSYPAYVKAMKGKR
jgi:hypothetical protein